MGRGSCSRRLISNSFFFMDLFIMYMYQIVYPMDDDKNKGFKGSYKASLVPTGNLAHSVQTQLPDHVYRLSPRNV